MAGITINSAWCKGCGICVAFCPKQTLELDRKGKVVQSGANDCVLCGMCALYCPDLAISADLPPANGESRQGAMA